MLAVNIAAALMLMLCAVRLDIEQKSQRDDIPRGMAPRFHHRFFGRAMPRTELVHRLQIVTVNPFPRRGLHLNKRITQSMKITSESPLQSEAEPPIIMLFRTRGKGQYVFCWNSSRETSKRRCPPRPWKHANAPRHARSHRSFTLVSSQR